VRIVRQALRLSLSRTPADAADADADAQDAQEAVAEVQYDDARVCNPYHWPCGCRGPQPQACDVCEALALPEAKTKDDTGGGTSSSRSGGGGDDGDDGDGDGGELHLCSDCATATSLCAAEM